MAKIVNSFQLSDNRNQIISISSIPEGQVYIKRKCAFSQKHTIFITKIQVYMFLLFVALTIPFLS